MLSSKLIPPSQVRKDLPAALDPVFAKATAAEPADRYDTAEAFRQALLEAAGVPAASDAEVAQWVRRWSAEEVVSAPNVEARTATLSSKRG